MSLEFRIFHPSPPLARFVHCYWTLAGRGGGAPQTIFPDGRMELVFQTGDTFTQIGEDGTRSQPRRLLIGQMRRYVIIAPGEHVRSFGIRFRPGGAFPLLGFPQGEVEDRILPLDDVHAALSTELSRAIEEATDPVAALEGVLLNRMPSLEDNPAVGAALSSIIRSRGQSTVTAVAAEAGVTSRQLERGFRERVGIGPKMFARIVRFQRVLQAEPVNWAALAADSGYFDQAHLVRDFHQFTGETPSAWAARRVAFLQDGRPRSD